MQTQPKTVNRVREKRLAAGYSQKQLANKAGTSYQVVQYLEYGDRYPSIPMAHKIAAALGCAVEDLWPMDGRHD